MKTSPRYKLAQFLHALHLSPDPKKSPDVQKMFNTIKKLEGGRIEFKITFYQNNDWSAESVNLPGIITAGDSHEDIDTMVEDAVFTYFNIPSRYCTSITLNRQEPAAKGSKAKQVAYYLSTMPAVCGA